MTQSWKKHSVYISFQLGVLWNRHLWSLYRFCPLVTLGSSMVGYWEYHGWAALSNSLGELCELLVLYHQSIYPLVLPTSLVMSLLPWPRWSNSIVGEKGGGKQLCSNTCSVSTLGGIGLIPVFLLLWSWCGECRIRFVPLATEQFHRINLETHHELSVTVLKLHWVNINYLEWKVKALH